MMVGKGITIDGRDGIQIGNMLLNPGIFGHFLDENSFKGIFNHIMAIER